MIDLVKNVTKESLVEFEDALNRLAPYMPAYTLSSYRLKLAALIAKLPKPTFNLSSISLIPKGTVQFDVSEGNFPKIAVHESLIENLNDEEIIIEDLRSSVTFKSLINCQVTCAPVHTSVFIERCSNCQFSVAGQQIRMSRSHNCKLSVYTVTGVFIEESSEYRIEELKDEVLLGKIVGLETKPNLWNHVFDFDA